MANGTAANGAGLHHISLISWNTARRRGTLAGQVEALVAAEPDVIALQEVTRGTVGLLREHLGMAGFDGIVDSVGGGTGPRRYGCLLATRHTLDPAPDLPIPWPEKSCSAVVHFPESTAIEIHTAHVPPGSTNGWTKIEVLEGVFAGLAKPSSLPRILCGDFNTPREELADGTVVTWAQRVRPDGTIRTRKRMRGADGARWDRGERQVLEGLKEHGIRDAYRAVHGYGDDAFSWVLDRRGKITRRRFDHVFLSEELEPKACSYHHAWREAGLSDHSAIQCDFATRRL